MTGKPITRRISNWRLGKLATQLFTVKPARFDFVRWVGDDWRGAPDLSCGTTGCAVGHATTIPAFQKAGLRLSYSPIGKNHYPCFNGLSHFEAVKSFFGISHSQALYLFHPAGVPDAITAPEARGLPGFSGLGRDATPKKVARRIREFIKWRRQHDEKRKHAAGLYR